MSSDDVTGGTFTITDLSSKAITSFSPVINNFQSAILGICSLFPGTEHFHPRRSGLASAPTWWKGSFSSRVCSSLWCTSSSFRSIWARSRGNASTRGQPNGNGRWRCLGCPRGCRSGHSQRTPRICGGKFRSPPSCRSENLCGASTPSHLARDGNPQSHRAFAPQCISIRFMSERY